MTYHYFRIFLISIFFKTSSNNSIFISKLTSSNHITFSNFTIKTITSNIINRNSRYSINRNFTSRSNLFSFISISSYFKLTIKLIFFIYITIIIFIIFNRINIYMFMVFIFCIFSLCLFGSKTLNTVRWKFIFIISIKAICIFVQSAIIIYFFPTHAAFDK